MSPSQEAAAAEEQRILDEMAAAEAEATSAEAKKREELAEKQRLEDLAHPSLKILLTPEMQNELLQAVASGYEGLQVVGPLARELVL